jgi:hypothetical protein
VDLVTWAERYKNIYEMDSEDRPSLEIINRDVELDKYLENLIRKRQNKKHA